MLSGIPVSWWKLFCPLKAPLLEALGSEFHTRKWNCMEAGGGGVVDASSPGGWLAHPLQQDGTRREVCRAIFAKGHSPYPTFFESYWYVSNFPQWFHEHTLQPLSSTDKPRIIWPMKWLLARTPLAHGAQGLLSPSFQNQEQGQGFQASRKKPLVNWFPAS